METTKQPTEQRKTWFGEQPTLCQHCNQALGKEFVDGRTVFGPWGILCTPCHGRYGVGLGTGKGQLYERQGNEFVKIAG